VEGRRWTTFNFAGSTALNARRVKPGKVGMIRLPRSTRGSPGASVSASHGTEITPSSIASGTAAFRLGESIAMTPGKIIYQNELMQSIQYAPSTREARRRPLLIVPPWINKFYVLDLQPKNSFIKWAVDQGHTVFAISWVNPDEKLAEEGFENYMLEGPFDGTGRDRDGDRRA
jgi:hypothetical protein